MLGAEIAPASLAACHVGARARRQGGLDVAGSRSPRPGTAAPAEWIPTGPAPAARRRGVGDGRVRAPADADPRADRDPRAAAGPAYARRRPPDHDAAPGGAHSALHADRAPG